MICCFETRTGRAAKSTSATNGQKVKSQSPEPAMFVIECVRRSAAAEASGSVATMLRALRIGRCADARSTLSLFRLLLRAGESTEQRTTNMAAATRFATTSGRKILRMSRRPGSRKLLKRKSRSQAADGRVPIVFLEDPRTIKCDLIPTFDRRRMPTLNFSLVSLPTYCSCA